jgi:hypothetical protein
MALAIARALVSVGIIFALATEGKVVDKMAEESGVTTVAEIKQVEEVHTDGRALAASTSTWTELSGHCSMEKLSGYMYSTVADAKSQCSSMSNCWGVYDNGCDENQFDVYLCDGDQIATASDISPSSSSCVFEKNTAQYFEGSVTDASINWDPDYSSESEAQSACDDVADCIGYFQYGSVGEPNFFTLHSGGTADCSIGMCGNMESQEYVKVMVKPTQAPTPSPTPSPTSAPTPSPTTTCADDDDQAAVLASGHGLTISGCVDVAAFCAHRKYGKVLQATCPATCFLPRCYEWCADDDDQVAALASGHGLTISGCADVAAFCGHWKYGSTLQAVCPATCRSCTSPAPTAAPAPTYAPK